MAEKTVIKAEQVVSRKGDSISYINDNNTLVNAKANTVIVQDEAPEEPTAAEAPFPVDIPPTDEPAPEVPPHVVAATENPKPDPKPKKKGKAKEIDVATAAAKKTPAKKVPVKTAAKKTPAKAIPKEGGVRTIGGKPVDLSEYQKTKAPGGGTSYNNGDAVAELLQGKDLEACYSIAAKRLKMDESELRKLYKHLNVGMQRMNLGNRLRKVMISK